MCPTPIGLHIIEQARNVLVQTHRIKNIIEEEKHSLSGIFKLGILPTIAPYLLPRFFPQLMKKYPQLDIRVVEMKTNDIKKALQTGDIDAGIVAGLAGMEEFRQIPLFYEQFYTYIARENRLFSNEVIRTSDLTGEQLWLLDEGHCFRDQLERFCQLKAARASQLAYHLGSMETFMRMVESGKGITFIPELAVLQLNGTQKELVHPFAIHHDICKTHQRNAEQGSIAKLTEINGETLVLEAMVWHGYENNQDTYQQHPHHIVIHILPFIFISQPGSQRCSQLS